MAPEHAENPFALAERLLVDVQLTPGQLAQLRAISTKYYTMIAALDQPVETNGPVRPEHRSMIAADIREILTAEQRAAFDRNLARVTASARESTA